MNPIPLIKFIGAWVFIVAAIVVLVLSLHPVAMVGVLALVAIAFSQAPSSWA